MPSTSKRAWGQDAQAEHPASSRSWRPWAGVQCHKQPDDGTGPWYTPEHYEIVQYVATKTGGRCDNGCGTHLLPNAPMCHVDDGSRGDVTIYGNGRLPWWCLGCSGVTYEQWVVRGSGKKPPALSPIKWDQDRPSRMITLQTVRTMEGLKEVVRAYSRFTEFAFDVETHAGRAVRVLQAPEPKALSRYGERQKVCPSCGQTFTDARRTYCTDLCRKAADKDKPALDPMTNEVWSISLAGPGRSDVIPMGHPDTSWPQLRRADVFAALEPLFFSDRRKIGHNVAFDLLSIASYYDGEIPPPPYGDTMVMTFLLNENLGAYSLGALARTYLGYQYAEKLGEEAYKVDFEKAMLYSLVDAKEAWMLWYRIAPRLRKKLSKLGPLFDLEMDVLRVLMEMRRHGAYVDVQGFRNLKPVLERQLQTIGAEITKMVGHDINLNSPKQLGNYLYDELKLRCPIMTETGQRSTNAGVLRSLAKKHPAPAKILAYKDVSKLLTVYVAGFLPTIDPDSRIRASFNQAIAKTGRMSCVAADSLIEMPRDLTKHPHGIPITDVRPGDWVYSYNWQRQLVLKRVTWVGQTGVKPTVVVAAENSEGDKLSLRLTEDHLVRLYNGDWRPAGSLAHRWGDPHRADGPRIMPMVRRQVDDGYIKFFPNSMAKGNGSGGGGKSREHRWVLEQITGKKISTKADVHHHDGNRSNNHPSNLEALTIAEHRGRRGDIHPGWGGDIEWMDFYQGPRDYRIVSVSPGPVEPVWDMEVEDVHNFIANGITVHNCSSPNLQNIPARYRENTEGDLIRRLFVAPPGKKLIVADYSQIELRILAHQTKDKMLTYAYREGLDLHAQTASLIYRVPIEKVTVEQRAIAKNSNFNLAFEGGPGRIVEMSGIGIREAEKVYDSWHQAYPGVKKWARWAKRFCWEHGYVETLFGRKRRLEDIKSQDMKDRSYAERQAVNHPIQGTAADIAKFAIVRVNDVLREFDAHLTLQIHDEFVIECTEGQVDEVLPLVRTAMEDIRLGSRPVLDVPLEVNIGVGMNWSTAK